MAGLSAIQYVTSGLTLAAFAIAYAFYAYRQKLKQRVELIKAMPSQNRLEAISATAGTYHIKIAGLTPQAQETVVLTELRFRVQRLLILAGLAVVLALILAVVAIVGILAPKPTPSPGPTPVHGEAEPTSMPLPNATPRPSDTQIAGPTGQPPPHPVGLQVAKSAPKRVEAARNRPCDRDDCANRELLSVTLPAGAVYDGTHYFSTAGYPNDAASPYEVGSGDVSFAKFSQAAVTTNQDGQIVVTTYYYNRSSRDRTVAISVDYHFPPAP